MTRARTLAAVLGGLLLLALLAPGRASAEPHFALAKQYARCTTCHYGATGGGLLTAYGRSLSRQEVSTWGRSAPGTEPAAEGFHEEAPFYGALGKLMGEFDLGMDLRPAHLEYDLAGTKNDRSFWMRADLEAAYRHGSWTFYGDFGRKEGRPGEEVKWTSWEYWGEWKAEDGLGLRAGRFLPAYGIRNADHTSYTRRDLGFDKNSQILGVEVSQTTDNHLYQLSFSPGTAESIFDDAREGERRFTATARMQFDLGTKNVLVLSGMFRDQSDFDPVSWYGGVAYGWSPHPRLAFWTELDERIAKGWGGTPEYTVMEEASVEVYRGVWIKFAPQMQTALHDVTAGKVRYALTAQLYPRPHWNLNLTWTHDEDRESGFDVKTWLIQLHLYL